MSLRLAELPLRLSTTIRYLTAMTMWLWFWTIPLKMSLQLQLRLRLHQRLHLQHPRRNLRLNLNQFRLQSLLQYQIHQRILLLVQRFLQSSTAWQTCLKRYLDQRFLCR